MSPRARCPPPAGGVLLPAAPGQRAPGASPTATGEKRGVDRPAGGGLPGSTSTIWSLVGAPRGPSRSGRSRDQGTDKGGCLRWLSGAGAGERGGDGSGTERSGRGRTRQKAAGFHAAAAGVFLSTTALSHPSTGRNNGTGGRVTVTAPPPRMSLGPAGHACLTPSCPVFAWRAALYLRSQLPRHVQPVPNLVLKKTLGNV